MLIRRRRAEAPRTANHPFRHLAARPGIHEGRV